MANRYVAQSEVSRAGQEVMREMLVEYVSDGTPLCEAIDTLGLKVWAVYELLAKDADFAETMNVAREIGAERIAERTRKIMRGEKGWSTGDAKRDRWVVEQDMKLLAVWHRKRYGQHAELEVKTANVQIPVGNDPIEAAAAYERLMRGGG